MKKTAYLLFLFSSIILLHSGCEKEEISLRSLQIGCALKVFSVPSWYSDTIYYSDNKISLIKRYYRNNDEKNTESRFEYGSDEVKIFVRDYYWGSWRDYIHYTLSFEESGISQIETNSGKVRANYFYEDNTLKYILYKKQNQPSDSIAVEWDLNGNNIARSMWFKFDRAENDYRLANTANYSYDGKNNPHRNSIHFLYNFYDCEEFSLDYFNRNNITAIESDIRNIHTDYIYNDYDFPAYIIFYDETDRETDRNILKYTCE